MKTGMPGIGGKWCSKRSNQNEVTSNNVRDIKWSGRPLQKMRNTMDNEEIIQDTFAAKPAS